VFNIGIKARFGYTPIYKKEQAKFGADRENFQYSKQTSVLLGATPTVLQTFLNKTLYISYIKLSKESGALNVFYQLSDSFGTSFDIQRLTVGSDFEFNFNKEPLRFKDTIRIVQNSGVDETVYLTVLGYLEE
jgi:hypothetical protein